jgi:hypothetical protein
VKKNVPYMNSVSLRVFTVKINVNHEKNGEFPMKNVLKGLNLTVVLLKY